MVWVRIVSYRSIKIIANLIKILCYPHFWLFPRKRFAIPDRARPLIRGRRRIEIPRTVWLTNYSQRVTLPIYLNYLFNRLMAPTFQFVFVTDQGRRDFLARRYSEEVVQAYDRLQIGAARADFWRVHVLLSEGGVYMDIDSHLVWPLGWVLGRHRRELFLIDRKNMLTNWFIATVPGTDTLARVAALILDNIASQRRGGVDAITGPAVYDALIDRQVTPTVNFRIVSAQGNFTNAFFQYIDKPEGKWIHEQRVKPVVRPE